MTYNLTASLVTYNNDVEMLKKAIHSFFNTDLNVKLYIIDNSPKDNLKLLKELYPDRIEYIFNPSNPGFGAAHNIALKKAVLESPYHLLLNPDIYFNKGVNKSILDYMNKNEEVGLLMPKIVYPDGSTQYVAKLLPTPVDFFVRRMIPIKSVKEKINNRFELRESGYNKIMEVPFLSGCYLVVRTEALKTSGFFDENYFMFCEDIDFCRNIINSGYKSIFFPEQEVVHAHVVKSFKSKKILKIYTKSMLYYFNKWGWFFDKERRRLNSKTLNQFK